MLRNIDPCSSCSFRFENKANQNSNKTCCYNICSQLPDEKMSECKNQCSECFGEIGDNKSFSTTNFKQCIEKYSGDTEEAFRCCIYSCDINDYKCQESCIDAFNATIVRHEGYHHQHPPSQSRRLLLILILLLLVLIMKI